MKLSVKERATGEKSAARQIRREGNIPAILYATGKQNEELIVNAAEFNAVLRKIKPGRLATTVFSIDWKGKQTRVIIKDIQYQLTTYQVAHIDFEELVDNVPVSVKVPILCVGVNECVGVKLGGYLRQVIRSVPVECLPKDIPAEFVIDVSNLGIKQSKRLSDITPPKGVKPLAKMDQVVVVIAKRTA